MSNAKNNDLLLGNIDNHTKYPIDFKELEQEAREALEPGPFGYIRSSAGGEETYNKNISSFSKYSIVPRFLTDVSSLNTEVTILGHTYPHPLFIAPVGVNKIAHEDGEIAVAKAAAKFNFPYIQSTVSSYSIEEIAAATPGSSKWFQLYWSSNKEIAFSMARRAEVAGYEAIVLTVDTVMLGWREEDIRNQFSPLKRGYGQGNYATDPVFMADLTEQSQEAIVDSILENIYHPTLNWNDITELRNHTSIPILIKGILHPDDAKLAIEKGIDGIIVSNHGGRQLDGVIASIDALSGIVEAVNGSIPVLFDSGVRRGSDAVKALALGATAVCIGRPFVWGLAAGGQKGVERVLENFLQETKVSISLAGVRNMEELRNMLVIKG
ncbi:alpha-hydroxy-acid oxidizing protein [Psychrobacillus sp. AK 1817]|uniref:alpha-hydroxy-acid oxidizing protein n=1 Tax=Psychrobacillus sp. AK 1817 TaxID=2303505 RepID=UPI0012466222|nr:alpha-hydroxy-acid oxidizing protein [Psychrobacillus sp. AK 1817]QEY19793.1 alpha-hydroxy-acid oxidizing protein [Psychrobacillus sp. AK 1817]